MLLYFFLLSMLWILLAVVTLVVLITLLIFRVKDLSEYDGQDWVMKEVAPNPAHDEVIERIKDMGRASRGLKDRVGGEGATAARPLCVKCA